MYSIVNLGKCYPMNLFCYWRFVIIILAPWLPFGQPSWTCSRTTYECNLMKQVHDLKTGLYARIDPSSPIAATYTTGVGVHGRSWLFVNMITVSGVSILKSQCAERSGLMHIILLFSIEHAAVYGHPRDWANVTIIERWPYYRGLTSTVEYNLISIGRYGDKTAKLLSIDSDEGQ